MEKTKRRNILKEMHYFLQLIQEGHKSVIWIMLAGAFGTVLSPYISLYYSSKILNQVLAGQFDSCWSDIFMMLFGVLICNLVARATYQSIRVFQSSCSQTVEQRIADKAFCMEYEQFEGGKVREDILKVRQLNRGRGGIWSQVRTLYEMIVAGLDALAATAVVLLLFYNSRETKWGSSIWTILLVVGVGAFFVYMIQKVGALSAKNTQIMLERNDKNNMALTYTGEKGTSDQYGKDIRIYRLERLMIDILLKNNQDAYLEWGRNEANYRVLFIGITQIIAALAYFFVGTMAIFKAIVVGDVLFYTGSITRMAQAYQEFVGKYNDFVGRQEHLKIYEHVLNEENMSYEGTLPIEKRQDYQYELEFQNVSFHYPNSEEMILRHVNLKFEIGKTMALVGRNGAGKTTLIKLLCRLYEPTEGKILLNGIDIRYYGYEEYVQIFSVVFQDFKLFAFPLDENIASGGEIDEERMDTVLEEVGMRERVSKMPDGIHTLLLKDNGEGQNLSGGEQQKLAIGRALYKDGAFVILDEPTAALDPIAEAEIYEHFNSMIQNKTAIYISHRMSSCKFCDKIIVMDQGMIVEEGSHEELLSNHGIYEELYETQAQYYKE